MTKPATPNLDKQRAIQDDANVISSFIDFLFDGHGYFLGSYEKRGEGAWEREEMVRVRWGDRAREEMIAKFFGIDYDALLKERDAVYEHIAAQRSNPHG